jgi:hypothetical protein
MNQLILVALAISAGLSLSLHAQSSQAAPGSMTNPGYIPIPGSLGVQQSRSAPTAEDRDGNPPTVSQLQEIHKNDSSTSNRTYRDKRSPTTKQQTSPMPRKSDMPRTPPLP